MHYVHLLNNCETASRGEGRGMGATRRAESDLEDERRQQMEDVYKAECNAVGTGKK